MRVLLNTKPLVLHDKTGVGYYVFNIYHGLLRAGIEVIPTLGLRSQGFVNSLSRVSSYIRRLFPTWPPLFLRQMGDLIVQKLARDSAVTPRYDIYHETSLDPLLEVDAISVCNLYDLSFIDCPEFLIKEFADYARKNISRNISLVKRVMVNTEYIKERAIESLNIPEEKIDIIPLAPSANYYRIEQRRRKPECILNLTKKDYVLYVGTIEPRKNLKVLMRAFKEIRGRYDLSLVLAGRLGWLYDDILRYPEESGIGDDVIFTRYVDEKFLLYLYNYASVFVYPSLYEGFGLPPIEAMSCGVPVIISDILPLREVAGDAALTFKSDDHEELAAMIEMVLTSDSLKEEMVQKGIQKVREYSWDRVAEATILTYKRALES